MSVTYAETRDNKNAATGGETFIAVAEFGKQTRAKVLLTYGNASQRGSKHISDQIGLLSQKKLRTALLDKKDVLANTERKEVLKIAR